MKRKVLAVILSIIFVFTQTTLVEAKVRSRSFSSGSRSISKSIGSSSKSIGKSTKSIGGSSSSSKSSGYKGSSSSSSSKSSASSKSSGYSGSSSRSVPGSYSSGSSSSSKSSGYSGSSSSSKSSGSSSSKSSGYTGGSSSSSSSSKSSGSSGGSSGYKGSSSSSGSSSGGYSSKSGSSASSKTSSGSVKSKTDTLKTSYMQDIYKKEVSQNNYDTYKQKLNVEQKKVYDSSFNSSYGSGKKMDFDTAMRTRTQRVSDYSTRPIRININTRHFGSPFSYGYAYVGPWDLWFLMRASDMFWYHHWNDIYPYRDYFEAAQFAEMEKRVRALENQNITRDTSYLDPDVDPDLQLSSDYMSKNVDRYYYSNRYAKPVKNPLATLVTIFVIVIILLAVLSRLSRRRPRNPYGNGDIY